jgi:hypothetical protein
VCVPDDGDEITMDAAPFDKTAEPKVTPPSTTSTVPPGVPGAPEATAIWKVNWSPSSGGSGVMVTDVVVAARVADTGTAFDTAAR